MVYFVQSRLGGPVKIGSSGNPDSRLKELQTSSSQPLIRLALRPGGRKEEAEFHGRFCESRVSGEWYEPTPALMALIWHSGLEVPIVDCPQEIAYRLPPMLVVPRLPVFEGNDVRVWSWTARSTFFELESHINWVNRSVHRGSDPYRACLELWKLFHDDADEDRKIHALPTLYKDEVLIGPYLLRKNRDAMRMRTSCPDTDITYGPPPNAKKSGVAEIFAAFFS